jgi:hypothetical protein
MRSGTPYRNKECEGFLLFCFCQNSDTKKPRYIRGLNVPTSYKMNNGTRGRTTLAMRSGTPYRNKECEGFLLFCFCQNSDTKKPRYIRGLNVPTSYKMNNGTRGRTSTARLTATKSARDFTFAFSIKLQKQIPSYIVHDVRG